MGWLLISTFLLTIPGSAFPKENWLGKIWFDKWVHIGMFVIMTFLWCWAILKREWVDFRKLKQSFFIIGVICFCYGVAMEFVQKYFIANRSFDAGDIIADGIGCVIGVVLILKWYKKN